jgi:hypothetical protein
MGVDLRKGLEVLEVELERAGESTARESREIEHGKAANPMRPPMLAQGGRWDRVRPARAGMG